MSVANSAYVEPLSLEGFIFGPDFVLDFINGSHFTAAAWPHFVISEADDLIKVYNVELNLSVVYPAGGNIVDKAYIMASLPDELLANWRPFSVCGYFIFDPTSMVGSRRFFHDRDAAYCAFGVLSLSERHGAPTERQFHDDRGGFRFWCAATLPGECGGSLFQGSVRASTWDKFRYLLNT